MTTHVEHITSTVKLRLRLQFYNRVYDYTDAYILVEGTMTVVRA